MGIIPEAIHFPKYEPAPKESLCLDPTPTPKTPRLPGSFKVVVEMPEGAMCDRLILRCLDSKHIGFKVIAIGRAGLESRV